MVAALPPAGLSTIPRSLRMTRIALAVLATLLLGSAANAAGPVAAGACGSQAKVPAEQRVANTARWTTASEENTFGYDVYRGDSEDGKFVRITKKPVLGNGTTSETHKYEFVDDTIDPCKEYWYYVEEISTSGDRAKFTTVFKARAKRHPDGTPAEAKAPSDKKGN
jgi:opacity protein-like surface antigen